MGKVSGLLLEMDTIKIHIESRDPMEELMDYLAGRVFHVSKECYLPAILASGEIKPNIDGKLETTFGSSGNSYFKNIGCVSVFDYRNIYDEKPQKFLRRCHPARPLRSDSGIAIFILKPEVYPKLHSWEGYKNDRRQKVVPHVEAGYYGPIPLSLVEQVMIVTISEFDDIGSIMKRGLHMDDKPT